MSPLVGPSIFFLLGIALLWGGAEILVKGAASLGRSLGISPLVVGLTIVACATSMPELLVSLAAILFHGTAGLALGNVVGSNIANVGLVLGLSAVVAPIRLRPSAQTRELPFMVLASIVFMILAWWGGILTRLDGVLLLLLLAWSVVRVVRAARVEAVGTDEEVEPPRSRRQALVLVVVGLGVLLLGAELMTRSGVAMARLLNVPEVIIGLTMVAVGTSLPELAASLVSVVRGQPELAFGNVVGSNLFNISFVAGTVSLVHPLDVPERMIRTDMPIMLIFSLAMYLLMRRSDSIGRRRGAILLAGYLAFIAWIALGG